MTFSGRLPESLLGRFPVLFRLREWAGHPECLKGNGHWMRVELEDALCCWLDATRPGGLKAAFLPRGTERRTLSS